MTRGTKAQSKTENVVYLRLLFPLQIAHAVLARPSVPHGLPAPPPPLEHENGAYYENQKHTQIIKGANTRAQYL
jgi:hypothetical protein